MIYFFFHRYCLELLSPGCFVLYWQYQMPSQMINHHHIMELELIKTFMCWRRYHGSGFHTRVGRKSGALCIGMIQGLTLKSHFYPNILMFIYLRSRKVEEIIGIQSNILKFYWYTNIYQYQVCVHNTILLHG